MSEQGDRKLCSVLTDASPFGRSDEMGIVECLEIVMSNDRSEIGLIRLATL